MSFPTGSAESTTWPGSSNLNGMVKNIYPLLREKFKDPTIYSRAGCTCFRPDIVRAEVFKAFGYFCTETSPHLSEYLPYFRKRPELISKFKLEMPERTLERKWKNASGKGITNWSSWLVRKRNFPVVRKNDYGVSYISMQSETRSIAGRVTGNVKNTNLITNLLKAVVSKYLAWWIKKGFIPCHVGDLPPQLAALNRTNINVQERTVRGIVEKDKTKIFQSISARPINQRCAALAIDTRNMVDELSPANAEFTKGYK